MHQKSYVYQNGGMYWYCGPFQIKIFDFRSTPGEDISEALERTRGFIAACSEYYFAMSAAINGYKLFADFVGSAALPNQATFFGTGNPNEPQVPGRATLGSMETDAMLEKLTGGRVEDYQAKSFIVRMFHLWDDRHRPRVAEALSVENEQVTCSLLGDVRHIRHVIIHDDSVVPADLLPKQEMIQQMWNLKAGGLLITHEMISTLMEQVNAINLNVNDLT